MAAAVPSGDRAAVAFGVRGGRGVSPAAPGDAGLFGRGRMAFTIDRGPGADRHRGLVALEGGGDGPPAVAA